MSAAITIKISDLLRQVLDQINALEYRFFEEDMNELNTILAITSIKSERIKTITSFLEEKRNELMGIEKWCRYKPQELSDSVLIDLKKSIKFDGEKFMLSEENMLSHLGANSYSHSIASITVLFRILSNIDKMLCAENVSVVKEPQALYEISTTQKHSSSLRWCKSDTDLLELATSLFEGNVIRSVNGSLTRKDTIDEFCRIFNLNIKDPESKLSRAKKRKKKETPFLDFLRTTFIDFCSRKSKQD